MDDAMEVERIEIEERKSPSPSPRGCTDDPYSSLFKRGVPRPFRKHPDPLYNDTVSDMWLSHLLETTKSQAPPFSDKLAVKLFAIKQIIGLDTATFTLTVRLYDLYVHAMNQRLQKITADPRLLTMVIVSIAVRFLNNTNRINVTWISRCISYYYNVPRQQFDIPTIRRVECHVLSAIDCRVPLYTEYDDLETVSQLMCNVMNLPEEVDQLCKRFLCIYIMNSKDILRQLIQQENKDNEGWRGTLNQVLSNRCFVPIGIIHCSIKILLSNAINMDLLTEFFASIPNIEKKYIVALSKMLHRAYLAMKNKKLHALKRYEKHLACKLYQCTVKY